MVLRVRLVPVLLALALAGGCASTASAPRRSASGDATSARPAASSTTAQASFAALERRYRADLGVYAVDTGTGRSVGYRADRRFAFASTYKLLIAGMLLRRDSDAQLAQLVRYSKADLQAYSPITGPHLATGMTVSALIAAALQYSDNTAANLLLARLGGPRGLTAALRALGDATTRSDRDEPDVNTAVPGDPRDTSTPRALAADLRGFVLGDRLTPARRVRLAELLRGNTTGGPYIRAGAPTGWTVGDKTGNGAYGTRNDIAVLWPPTGAPVVLAVLTDRRTDKSAASDDALIADAARTALAALNHGAAQGG